MRRWALAVLCLLCAFLAGCQTTEPLDWSELLKEYGQDPAALSADSPDAEGTPAAGRIEPSPATAPEAPDRAEASVPAARPAPPAAPAAPPVAAARAEFPAPPARPPAPAPSAPPDEAAEPSARRIQAEAMLQIKVLEDPALNGRYEVSSIGGISLGYLGPVLLYNLTEREAEEKIQKLLEAREFRNATVTVEILRSTFDKIRIEGEFIQGGVIRIGSDDEVPLQNLLMRAGGVKGAPEETMIRIVRGGMTALFPGSLPAETYRLVGRDGAPVVPDVMVRNNDLVQVVRYDPQVVRTGGRSRGRSRTNVVLVLGEVNRQGFYQFRPTERFTMMNLVFRMGGLPTYANDRAVRVIRRNVSGVDEEFRVNVREIMREGDPDLDFELAHGDRIIIPARRISLF